MKINLTWALLAVAVIVAVGIGAYIYGTRQSSTPTLQEETVQNQLLNIQNEASQKALDEAVKAANPFQVSNPLEGVNTNPLEEVRKKLNPFE